METASYVTKYTFKRSCKQKSDDSDFLWLAANGAYSANTGTGADRTHSVNLGANLRVGVTILRQRRHRSQQ